MSFLFGGDTNAENNPQATGINIQTSIYGACIKLVYGQARVAGNLIWYGDFEAEEREVGGKGGTSGGGGSYIYYAAVMIAICHGPINGIGKIWKNEKGKQSSEWDVTIKSGTHSQTAWAYLTTNHPDEALNYRGVAYGGFPDYKLGSSPTLPNLNFEVQGFCQNISGKVDADPAEIVEDYLTNQYYGAAFPSARLAALTDYSNYCLAAGLIMSPVFEEQSEAAQQIQDIVKWTNAEFVWNGQTLDIVPYGDEEITGNGATFTPPSAPEYSLTYDDLLLQEGEPPVRITRARPADAVNAVKGEYCRRSKKYQIEEVEARDELAIEMYGLRDEGAQQLHFFCLGEPARLALQLYLQRQGVRNQYEFYLGWKYIRLDPMDVIAITDPLLGLDEHWVRIVSIEEDEECRLRVTAEDYAQGTGHAPAYPYAEGEGHDTDTEGDADPGDVNVPMIFEPPYELCNQTQVWAAVSGSGEYWAGCEVWVSTAEAGPYKLVGTITGPARMGELSAVLAEGDPIDETNTLSVDLTGSEAALTSGTEADAEAFVTLCRVGSELLAYATATLTATYEYDLTYLVRGGYGTTNASHAIGTQFARIDNLVFKYPYDSEQIGTTLYFKFLSFNPLYQSDKGRIQELDDVDAYTFTVSGDSQWNPLSLSAAPSGNANINWSGQSAIMDVDSSQSPTYGDILFMATDGELELADADLAATTPGLFMASTTGVGNVRMILPGCFVQCDTWTWSLSGSRMLWLSKTAGKLTQTQPTAVGVQIQFIGIVIDEDKIYFNPSAVVVERKTAG